MISPRIWRSTVYYSNWWHEPGGGDFKTRFSKISCNSQFHSEHQAIYTLMVKKNHTSTVFNHKDKPQVAKMFSVETYEYQQLKSTYFYLLHLRGAQKHFPRKYLHFVETEGSQNSCLISGSFLIALRILKDSIFGVPT